MFRAYFSKTQKRLHGSSNWVRPSDRRVVEVTAVGERPIGFSDIVDLGVVSHRANSHREFESANVLPDEDVITSTIEDAVVLGAIGAALGGFISDSDDSDDSDAGDWGFGDFGGGGADGDW